MSKKDRYNIIIDKKYKLYYERKMFNDNTVFIDKNEIVVVHKEPYCFNVDTTIEECKELFKDEIDNPSSGTINTNRLNMFYEIIENVSLFTDTFYSICDYYIQDYKKNNYSTQLRRLGEFICNQERITKCLSIYKKEELLNHLLRYGNDLYDLLGETNVRFLLSFYEIDEQKIALCLLLKDKVKEIIRLVNLIVREIGVPVDIKEDKSIWTEFLLSILYMYYNDNIKDTKKKELFESIELQYFQDSVYCSLIELSRKVPLELEYRIEKLYLNSVRYYNVEDLTSFMVNYYLDEYGRDRERLKTIDDDLKEELLKKFRLDLIFKPNKKTEVDKLLNMNYKELLGRWKRDTGGY